jgi:hypothetical protein
VQRAAQRAQRAHVEIGGHGDHRLDALGDVQRVQLRDHLARDVARRHLVAAELAPVAERHFVRPPARHGQRGAARARHRATVSTASGSLASSSPSRAMDRCGGRSGCRTCQMFVGKLTLESALYCRSGGSSSGAIPS